LVDNPKFCLSGDGTDLQANPPKRISEYRIYIKNYMKLFSDCVYELITLPQPTVALIKGHAPAGGTVLSLACDARLGSTAGFAMGLNEVQVGMAPPMWVHNLALNAMGPRKSALAMQKGTIFSTEDCLKFGLVDQVVHDDELVDAGVKVIEEYLKLPSTARIDAKLKSVSNVTCQFTEEALDAVVASITGPEFQVTAKAIIQRMSVKK
jgi:Delta3-Delta2-enoyl-CoA isomerase